MRCPKCQGLVIENHGEVYCINCGYRCGDNSRIVGEIGVGRPIGHNLKYAAPSRVTVREGCQSRQRREGSR